MCGRKKTNDGTRLEKNITTSSKTETEIAKFSESFEMEARKIRGSEYLPPESLIPACGNKAFP
jgi:hypothetical protein